MGVYLVAVDEVKARDRLGLVGGLRQVAVVVDVAAVVLVSVFVGVLEADVRGSGWPVVVTAVAGGAEPGLAAVIQLMRAGADGHHPAEADGDDYLPFTTSTLRAVNRVTVDAVQRLESLRPGDPWLPWVDVPHVLYHGSIPLGWFSARPD